MPVELPDLSVVIPVYNEEENIRLLYGEIRTAMDRLGKPYEILFVDDGSRDASFEQLIGLKDTEEKDPANRFCRSRIIRFRRNFGQTAAMQAGFDHARGDVIVSMDGDLQNDPADIPMFLEKLNEGYDIVCGWRKNRQDKAITRILPSKVANWLIGKITGVSIHDNGCSLKAYRREVIQSIRLYSDMHRFIPAVSSVVGATVAEIVVNHRARAFGHTKYGLSRIWKVLFDMLAVKMIIHFSQRPLAWFSLFAGLFLLFSLFFAVVAGVGGIGGRLTTVTMAACFLFFTLFGVFLSWGVLCEFYVNLDWSRKKHVCPYLPERSDS